MLKVGYAIYGKSSSLNHFRVHYAHEKYGALICEQTLRIFVACGVLIFKFSEQSGYIVMLAPVITSRCQQFSNATIAQWSQVQAQNIMLSCEESSHQMRRLADFRYD
ncbi:hypothetical protein PHLGIDRAFT_192432 [Phlebiopsis gigantea 11061_1 CR5-6]|uniref:Uncharacterized protein n=1 Tax=Phlebiopsis gigantea (strain 11061_1 CR5-6) TaxID=745531 RepID=A0A0C3NI15_PHLG1|nr:hypothetical protein PHLGIDRAFT_192432 [Phlebiopsis gigantea 11061_1 CR5-6]